MTSFLIQLWNCYWLVITDSYTMFFLASPVAWEWNFHCSVVLFMHPRAVRREGVAERRRLACHKWSSFIPLTVRFWIFCIRISFLDSRKSTSVSIKRTYSQQNKGSNQSIFWFDFTWCRYRELSLLAVFWLTVHITDRNIPWILRFSLWNLSLSPPLIVIWNMWPCALGSRVWVCNSGLILPLDLIWLSRVMVKDVCLGVGRPEVKFPTLPRINVIMSLSLPPHLWKGGNNSISS